MLFGAAMIFALAQAAAPAAKAAPQPVTKATIDAQVKANFQRVDTNKDGKIDKAESDKFRAASLAAQDARRKQSLAAAFAKLDTNKDGSISRQEFDALSPPRTASAANPWFAANDIDKNGVVELNEAIAKAERNFEALDKDHNGVLSAQEANAPRMRRAPAPKK
ncbi:MAG TPA: EF-hand domain-containing protein [Allosphingosinicella sp.]|nr:EF-hand domain-containing protein [Allosphingosinicella sp.]